MFISVYHGNSNKISKIKISRLFTHESHFAWFLAEVLLNFLAATKGMTVRVSFQNCKNQYKIQALNTFNALRFFALGVGSTSGSGGCSCGYLPMVKVSPTWLTEAPQRKFLVLLLHLHQALSGGFSHYFKTKIQITGRKNCKSNPHNKHHVAPYKNIAFQNKTQKKHTWKRSNSKPLTCT